MADPRLVLASSSPSRLSILRSAGIEPLVLVPDVAEDDVVAELRTRVADPSPAEIVTCLAAAKANAVIDRFAGAVPDGAVVVAGDSMLLLDGELQGKPHTVERTVERWRAQRGRPATLVTGHAFTRSSPVDLFPGVFAPVTTAVSETVVHFADATDRDIAAYAATGEPLECAGAFTLEALGGWFIDRIEGDPSSVVGLSLPLLRRAVEGYGLAVSDLWER
ncbi:nucleoside triphosphate pyrophosphatase [uncultured Corynebacterium sp.]|uniref:nucleoside triphosphate pyrophosphatase n=1 Tax=uncultured Corynebacterium sp. TaxID=159447 RepID=UPI0025D7212F|nr:nucleoside triphosphate pyrophosphatase [uncultured Corynebacterium sp.]